MVAWQAVLVLAAFGAIGGLTGTLNSDGLHLPETIDGVWTPGFIGTMFVGAIAAAVAWAIPRSDAVTGVVALQLKDFAYAVVAGFSGGKWLNAEADKRLFRRAITVAVAKPADRDAAAAVSSASARAALRAVLKMR
jgi:hypothetical protein